MKALALAVLIVASPPRVDADYPRIARLDSRDPLFRQLQDDIEQFHRAEARGEGALPPFALFVCDRGDADLFALAARLNLPYDTIATANSLSSPEDLAERETVLVPNMPGLFVPRQPATDLEEVVLSSSMTGRGGGLGVTLHGATTPRDVVFYPGERFNPVERAFFLRVLFRFPLSGRGRLSSLYGTRANPFTGHPQFHNGIDIAAPAGTTVVVARDGSVAEVGRDPVLGLFVRVSHEGGYETLYGHLEEAVVSLNQEVASGMMIGKVGTTGLTTGPHLHFEIRRKGSLRDPLPLIRVEGR